MWLWFDTPFVTARDWRGSSRDPARPVLRQPARPAPEPEPAAAKPARQR